MSDSNRLYRLLISLMPVFALAAFLLLTGNLTKAAIALLVVVVATMTVIIYLYEKRLDDIHRDTEFRLKSIKDERNDTPLLTNIVEGISDPLILLDQKRQVVEANRAARALLGAGIVGKDIAFHLRHPNALAAIEKAMGEGTASELEITLSDPFDRDYLMRVNPGKAPTPDSGERAENFIIISIYDVSKIKLAEKMRVDFVANASHELRTPLASLSGFIETLQDMGEKDPKTRQKFLNIMEAEAGRMRRLIDDLLSLSRIEMEQHLAPDQALDIEKTLKSVSHAMALRLKEKDCQLRYDFEPGLPQILGDSDQLQQVFTNLFDNALKYGQSGTPILITARADNLLPGGRGPGIRIAIFNSGSGIAAEHIPRLTERFYRIDAARSRSLGGTGLGLAIVKHILTRHRGTLNIESTPGIGTTVTVGLPQAPVAKS